MNVLDGVVLLHLQGDPQGKLHVFARIFSRPFPRKAGHSVGLLSVLASAHNFYFFCWFICAGGVIVQSCLNLTLMRPVDCGLQGSCMDLSVLGLVYGIS